MISLFGNGFIGGNYAKLYPNDVFIEPRSSLKPQYNDVLYFRSTNSNYNIFEDASLDVKTNLLLFTETLKNITPNHNFCHISSWFVYWPKGFYSITKLAQEQLLESYCLTFKIPYKILRLSNVFGKDTRASAKKNALEFLISKIKNNEDIQLYEGDNFRNFLDVETCCKAIKFVMDNGENGQIYDIGADKSYKMRDLLEFCIKETNSKSKIEIVKTPEFHNQVQIKDFHMNTSKLTSLGFDNKINIYDKLRNLLA